MHAVRSSFKSTCRCVSAIFPLFCIICITGKYKTRKGVYFIQLYEIERRVKFLDCTIAVLAAYVCNTRKTREHAARVISHLNCLPKVQWLTLVKCTCRTMARQSWESYRLRVWPNNPHYAPLQKNRIFIPWLNFATPGNIVASCERH